MIRTLFVIGTRPEAIKLCPIIRYIRVHEPGFQIRICVTAQHRELLDQVLQTFEVVADDDLDIMRPGQTLAEFDTDLSRAAVVVEWGEGLAEALSDERLVIRLTRHPDDTRTAELDAVGGDWADRLRLVRAG